MKGQHMEMVLALRSGRFDRVIAGLEMGGMDILTAAPQVDLQELGKKTIARWRRRRTSQRHRAKRPPRNRRCAQSARANAFVGAAKPVWRS